MVKLMLLRRLVHALNNHGPAGLMRRAAGRVVGRLRPGATVAAAAGLEPGAGAALQHPFDLIHGTDTGGYIPGEQLGGAESGNGAAAFWNTAYYAISPSTLMEAFKLLPDSAESFTFVDLGCGKGRALLIAEQFGFAQAVGVELSAELVAVARQNAAGLGPRVRVEQDDAATYVYPAAPLVIFLYHPFLRPLLRRVLRNLERQLRASPRPVYLLYANPGYQQTIRRFRWLEQVWDFSLRLSPEDAAADRHGVTHERYTLYRAVL